VRAFATGGKVLRKPIISTRVVCTVQIKDVVDPNMIIASHEDDLHTPNISLCRIWWTGESDDYLKRATGCTLYCFNLKLVWSAALVATGEDSSFKTRALQRRIGIMVLPIPISHTSVVDRDAMTKYLTEIRHETLPGSIAVHYLSFGMPHVFVVQNAERLVSNNFCIQLLDKCRWIGREIGGYLGRRCMRERKHHGRESKSNVPTASHVVSLVAMKNDTNMMPCCTGVVDYRFARNLFAVANSSRSSGVRRFSRTCCSRCSSASNVAAIGSVLVRATSRHML